MVIELIPIWPEIWDPTPIFHFLITRSIVSADFAALGEEVRAKAV